MIEAVSVNLDLDPWLSLRGLVDYSGLSRRTLQDAIHDPSRPLRHVHIGVKVLVRASWFDQWATARECRKAQALARLIAADAQALLKARPAKNA